MVCWPPRGITTGNWGSSICFLLTQLTNDWVIPDNVLLCILLFFSLGNSIQEAWVLLQDHNLFADGVHVSNHWILVQVLAPAPVLKYDTIGFDCFNQWFITKKIEPVDLTMVINLMYTLSGNSWETINRRSCLKSYTPPFYEAAYHWLHKKWMVLGQLSGIWDILIVLMCFLLAWFVSISWFDQCFHQSWFDWIKLVLTFILIKLLCLTPCLANGMYILNQSMWYHHIDWFKMYK